MAIRTSLLGFNESERKRYVNLKLVMDNNQNTQQQSPDLSYSKLAQSKITLSAKLDSLLELIKDRPRLVLSGTWVFLVAIAAIAALSLSHTNREKQAESQPPLVAATPVLEPAKTSSHMGLWLLGTVALTFGAGSFVIYKQLNRSSWLRQSIQNSSTAVLTPPTEQEISSLEPKEPVSTSIESAMPAETELDVMVLSPQDSHRHDSGEESLAEMMDIRKQLSLSSILAQPLKK